MLVGSWWILVLQCCPRLAMSRKSVSPVLSGFTSASGCPGSAPSSDSIWSEQSGHCCWPTAPLLVLTVVPGGGMGGNERKSKPI